MHATYKRSDTQPATGVLIRKVTTPFRTYVSSIARKKGSVAEKNTRLRWPPFSAFAWRACWGGFQAHFQPISTAPRIHMGRTWHRSMATWPHYAAATLGTSVAFPGLYIYEVSVFVCPVTGWRQKPTRAAHSQKNRHRNGVFA